jgi:hypothetical protein
VVTSYFQVHVVWSQVYPSSMFYPTTSSRPPQWSPSPKRNQFRERRSSAESHGRPSAYDYQGHRAPSSHYVKRKASQRQPHSSPQSSSLLERIELPDRMGVNEEALNVRHNKDSSNPPRIYGSQMASPDFPRKQNVNLVCCCPWVPLWHMLTLYAHQ